MHPTQPRTLIFHKPTLHPENGELRFAYEHQFEARPAERYEERLVIPRELWREDVLASPAGQRLLLQLSLALGLSYWKMYCPRELTLWTSLTHKEADAWNQIYRDALGEFFYRNQLNPMARIPFTGTDDAAPASARRDTHNLAIVPFGGGKDSLLTLHLLQQASIPFESFTLGTSTVQEQGLARMNLQAHTIKRVIDPEMIRKSKAGEAYNGHVSITTIYAFTATLIALLRDARWVVFSNEWSAGEGNIEWNGLTINHQWSKTLEAELLTRDLIHASIAPDLTVFSLLRPLHEVGIVSRFARELPHLFGSFSSCNRNFVIASDRPTTNNGRAYWCGICPKCAFVGLLFACFLPVADLERLMGSNPLTKPELIPLYRDLLGRGDLKPFECVGTFDETRACFAELKHRPGYQDLLVVRWWTDQHVLFEYMAHISELIKPIPEAVAQLPALFRPLYDHR